VEVCLAEAQYEVQHHEVASDRLGGSAETPAASAAHSNGRSRGQLANLANIALYVVARIVAVQLLGQHEGNSE